MKEVDMDDNSELLNANYELQQDNENKSHESELVLLSEKLKEKEKEVESLFSKLVNLSSYIRNMTTNFDQEKEKIKKNTIKYVISIVSSLFYIIKKYNLLNHSFSQSVDDSIEKDILGFYNIIISQLLANYDVTVVIPKVGDKFDPMRHRALSVISDKSAKESGAISGTIAEVFSPMFFIKTSNENAFQVAEVDIYNFTNSQE